MDSLTQIVLGAAVAETVIGKKIGRKASLYGAILGTLPDLDVLWVKNAVDSFTEHRGFSHSLITLFLVSPIFAMLFKRWHPIGLDKQNISFRYWVFSVYAVLATHPLLDWFTVYGTQLFWPLTNFPFGLGSVFIIDPLYTVPFALCLLATIITRKRFPVILGIGMSCSYLTWSLYAQNTQAELFSKALEQKGVEVKKTMTLPMPLNTMLWKNISIVENGYWVGMRSVFDSEQAKPQFRFFKSQSEKIQPVLTSETVKKLQFFTKGFYQVKQQDDGIWVSDLRMGGFGNFVFNFKVAEVDNASPEDLIKPIEPDLIVAKSLRPTGEKLNQSLDAMKQRIFDENVDLFPLFDGAEMINQ